jgi:cellulose synthase/poly-beta-1,6-N-acetylglucosamine synthase-like glycosyltransferase
VIEILFWLLAGVTVYVYAGYPVVLAILARLFPAPVRKAPIEPTVSLLVAAFNEAAVIEAKVTNALALDYPADRLDIVVASDGSTDGTPERAVARAEGGRVRVITYPVNRGKLAVLNQTVPALEGEIVVFSDAASMLAPDALRVLVASFADPAVGAVSGIYRVRKAEQTALGGQEDLYWKYETFLKVQEAALGSILGCHGSLYAIRKSLYPFPEAGTINDDYVIPIRILQHGYRVAYETGAVAYEEAHEMSGFSRRVRIMTGNIQQLREMRAVLRPVRPRELFFFLSHKLGRLVVPFCMLGLLVLNLLLLDRPLYRALGIAQAGFYGLAVLGALWKIRPKILRLPYYFSMINAAAFAGVYFAAFGRGRMAWKRDLS